MVCGAGCRPRTTRRLAGYSSWYNRYQNIDEASIREDLNGCKTLFRAGDLFQIDDGWERKVGDWLEPDPAKFPNGCARWQMQRMKAAFWQDCGWHRSSAKRNPCSAKITRTGCCRRTVSPGAAAATGAAFMRWTSTTREVQAYLKQVFDRVLQDWGFDLVKLDFLYGAAPFGNARESRAGRMQRAMALLRSWCGDQADPRLRCAGHACLWHR